MTLPKINHPTFPLLVPSLNAASQFRPFTVREEKVLLMAKESDDPAVDHLRAIHHVVGACECSGLDVDRLATFDLEWLFLKLTEVSVGPTVTQSFTDVEEQREGVKPLPVHTFTIKLSDVTAPEVNSSPKIVALDSGDGVELGYPPASLYLDPNFTRTDGGDAVLYRSTRRIFTATSSYDVHSEGVTQQEVIDYYDSWLTKDMDAVREFLGNVPTMSYACKYTNSLGHERSVNLTSLSDFFTF